MTNSRFPRKIQAACFALAKHPVPIIFHYPLHSPRAYASSIALSAHSLRSSGSRHRDSSSDMLDLSQCKPSLPHQSSIHINTTYRSRSSEASGFSHVFTSTAIDGCLGCDGGQEDGGGEQVLEGLWLGDGCCAW